MGIHEKRHRHSPAAPNQPAHEGCLQNPACHSLGSSNHRRDESNVIHWDFKPPPPPHLLLAADLLLGIQNRSGALDDLVSAVSVSAIGLPDQSAKCYRSLMVPLICALIAFAGSLLVFGAGQWILHWRDETKLLRQKAEDLSAIIGKARMQRLDWLGAHESQDSLEGWPKVRAAQADSVVIISNLCRFYFPALNGACGRAIQAAAKLGHLDYGEFRRLPKNDLLDLLDGYDGALHEIGEAFHFYGGSLFRMRKEDLLWPKWIFRIDAAPKSPSPVEVPAASTAMPSTTPPQSGSDIEG